MGDTQTQRGSSVIATAALLFLLPLATYWRTIFHRFGFRDDYAILREALEEPGKVTRVCASQGRPFFGWLLEQSARAASGIVLKDVRGLAAGAFCAAWAAQGAGAGWWDW